MSEGEGGKKAVRPLLGNWLSALKNGAITKATKPTPLRTCATLFVNPKRILLKERELVFTTKSGTSTGWLVTRSKSSASRGMLLWKKPHTTTTERSSLRQAVADFKIPSGVEEKGLHMRISFGPLG